MLKGEVGFMLIDYCLIMLGGALGSGARFWASGVVADRIGGTFPFGTIAVNITGCFVIGLFAAVSDPQGPFLVAPRWRLFFMVGLCGGYTTFSAFSLQTLDLAAEGDWLRATLNLTGSFLGCMLAVWLGRVFANSLFVR